MDDRKLIRCVNCQSDQAKVVKDNIAMTASVQCQCGRKIGEVPFEYDFKNGKDTSHKACELARQAWNSIVATPKIKIAKPKEKAVVAASEESGW